jgi:hypothetical protein
VLSCDTCHVSAEAGRAISRIYQSFDGRDKCIIRGFVSGSETGYAVPGKWTKILRTTRRLDGILSRITTNSNDWPSSGATNKLFSLLR